MATRQSLFAGAGSMARRPDVTTAPGYHRRWPKSLCPCERSAQTTRLPAGGRRLVILGFFSSSMEEEARREARPRPPARDGFARVYAQYQALRI